MSEKFKLLSNGRLLALPATLAVLDPATEQVIAEVPDCTAELLDATVRAAQAAFAGWSTTPLPDRAARLQALAHRIGDHADELAALLTREQGKPLAMARAEVLGCVHWCRSFAAMALPVAERTDAAGIRWVTQRVPLGVVAAIAPWNFPLSLAVWKLAPALLAGNTVIVKPSPFTPLATLRLGELAADLFPPGVLNVLSGGDDLGPMLTAHPGIAKVAFTGSTATGRRVMASAAPTLKHLTLELGGNDAAIVMPDVDVAKVARRLFMGAFLNSGQVCIAAKRIFVHDSIYAAFAAAFVAAAKAAPMGPGHQEGVLLGPVQNRPQYERVKDLIAATRDAGHRFLTGGEVPEGPGYFIPPTVVDNPPDDARVVVEEPFGPIVPLLRFSDVDEVVRRANDSEFGLGGSVWSADVGQARAIAVRLQAGTVWINNVHLLDPQSPFAGRKQSGIGAENGIEGLLEFTAIQTLVG
ncbi:aldehyde dehydrogenase family protein [Variovorax saccharolyticus]|uniref:aldehyde dehydrogenase family protein n=1 Tax=Variovorax saccharolyticus TaxID=3053516 RepID=UPI0025791603|nr:aldehyde dehydrogenase family protein [Variovorax sp. J22R187]MDM0021099.1 aldehyde dehydrogenase family protein [Variovorax sp. J22R187]